MTIFALTLSLASVNLGGCSLVESFDGYADGARTDADAPRDASADVGVDAGSDAGTLADASANESGADDGGDATTNLGYCASLSPAPLFCDDFDTLDLAQKWDGVHTLGGLPSRTTGNFTSPPYGLRVHVDPVDANTQLWAVVAKSFTALDSRPVHGSASFALRVTEADTNANALTIVWALHYDSGPSFWELQVVATYNGSVVSLLFIETGNDAVTGNFYREQSFGHTMGLAEWHRLRVVITLGRVGQLPVGANSAQVFLDGTLEVAMPLVYKVVAATPQLFLGTGYVHRPSTPWNLVYDDAMIDLTSP